MSSKRHYQFNITPRWLLYSGLPTELNRDYGPDAWVIFQCLIQLDCRWNRNYPGRFDQGFDEIANLTGKTKRTISKYIGLFEKGRWLTVKRGKSIRGKSTFQLANPIKTPIHPKDIPATHGGLLNRKGRKPMLRYGQVVKAVHQLEGPTGERRSPQLVKDMSPTGEHLSPQREVKRRNRKPSRERKSKNKGKDPRIKKFIDAYYGQYKKKYDDAPDIRKGKDGELVKNMLLSHSLESLISLLPHFWQLRDDLIEKNGHTVAMFKVRLNKLVEKKKEEGKTW